MHPPRYCTYPPSPLHLIAPLSRTLAVRPDILSTSVPGSLPISPHLFERYPTTYAVEHNMDIFLSPERKRSLPQPVSDRMKLYSSRTAGQATALSPGTVRDTEPLKHVVSNGTWEILSWHIWGIISVSVSMVLIGLNLTQYALGGELGRDADATANIISALQLLIQMHGLSVTASLFQIARQWIHRSLLSLDRGIPLGLVGAEREVGSPSFVISHSYLAAVKYAASLWWGPQPQTEDDVRRKSDTTLVTAFLFVSCIVSVLAAPASGALMIPRVFWFFDSAVHSPTPDPPTDIARYSTYPHLIMPPQEGAGAYAYTLQDRTSESDPLRSFLFDNALDYWRDFDGGIPVFVRTKEALTVHYLSTPVGMKYVNVSTTWGRSLDDDTGVGRTYAKAIMESDVILAKIALSATSTDVWLSSCVNRPKLTPPADRITRAGGL